MRILVIGDIIGKPGRRAVNSLVSDLRGELQLDLVIANAENSAGGKGLTIASVNELIHSGVDVLTTGNHIWAQKEILPHLNGDLPILRPLNYSPCVPGRGYIIWKDVLIVNLSGRTFMGDAADCPFRAMDSLLNNLRDRPPVIIIDFHAETTSEKNAMGHYLDGRVSAIVGTHTHVGTIDARILNNGTAIITDIGMVGPVDSVIGNDPREVIDRFLTHMPNRLSVGKGKTCFNSVLVEVEQSTGKAVNIIRIDRVVD